jgi:hypothetical protein
MLMKTIGVVFLVAAVGLAGRPATAQDLAPQLEAFRPFLGKTWRGEFANSTPERPMVDVSRWERVLNGQAVRIVHSVNDGEYGGETIIRWDAERDSLAFYYFTTAGFMTTGTLWFEDGRFVSHETVVGNAQGITEVRAVGEVLDDGRMVSSSRYLQNGTWVDGHRITYTPDDSAEPMFR